MRLFFKRIRLWIPTFVGMTVFLFLPASVVHSQQFSFSLAPQKQEVIAKPGAQIILPYHLTNLGDPTVVQLEAYLLQVADANGTYELVPYYADNPAPPHISP